MVTIRPIKNTEVRCNLCNKLVGVLQGGVLQLNDELEKTFMRLRIYDVQDDGKHLNENEFEVDFCGECTKKFEKIMKKFKLTKSKVPRSSTGSANK